MDRQVGRALIIPTVSGMLQFVADKAGPFGVRPLFFYHSIYSRRWTSMLTEFLSKSSSLILFCNARNTAIFLSTPKISFPFLLSFISAALILSFFPKCQGIMLQISRHLLSLCIFIRSLSSTSFFMYPSSWPLLS